jgi:hypothetical protein
MAMFVPSAISCATKGPSDVEGKGDIERKGKKKKGKRPHLGRKGKKETFRLESYTALE